MTDRGRKVLVVLVPIVAVLVVLGVVETALRVFAPLHLVGIQSAYQYDPELGYRLSPGVHRYQLTDHLEEIRTNPLGTVNFQDQFGDYPVLVFAVGDSFTQGTGNSSDASYPFQLDMLLNQDGLGRYQKRFGVVNLGLAAFGTEQSLIALERYAASLGKPRYILYLGSDNDWEDDVLLRAGYRHRHLVAGSPRWEPFVGPLLWISQFELVKRAKVAISEIRRARLVRDATPAAAGAGEPSVAERVWPTVERIDALARKWDAVLVLGWANPGTPSYAWLKARAAEKDIAFADWAPGVASVQEAMPDLLVENPHSGAHWRPWANGVIARAYAHAMGLRPTPPSPHLQRDPKASAP